MAEGVPVRKLSRITKIDAAEAQIKSAIRLYFMNDNPISVYALAAGAREVLTTIGGKKRVRTLLHGLAHETGNKIELYIGKASRFARFFKHADRDPGAVLTDFTDEDARTVLFIAATDLGRVAGGKPYEAQIYEVWWFVTNIKSVSGMPLRRQAELRKMIKLFPPGFRSLDLTAQKAAGLQMLDRYATDEGLRMEMIREYGKIKADPEGYWD